MIARILLPLALALMTLTPAAAASPDEQRGKTFALNNCARCHSIDKVTQSPLKIAPPFRTLHTRYPIETIAEALAEGIVNRPSDHAAVSARSRPDPRPAGVSEDARIALRQAPSLEGVHRPGDHVLGDPAERFAERGDGRRRLDRVELLAGLEQA